jgi:hypothetical protein
MTTASDDRLHREQRQGVERCEGQAKADGVENQPRDVWRRREESPDQPSVKIVGAATRTCAGRLQDRGDAIRNGCGERS